MTLPDLIPPIPREWLSLPVSRCHILPRDNDTEQSIERAECLAGLENSDNSR